MRKTIFAFAISIAGCNDLDRSELLGDAAHVDDTAADAVTDESAADADVLVNPTCNALNLEGVPKAGIGGYGSSVPASTGGPIADGSYVLVEGYISGAGELYVEERRRIVVSAGRIEMIREQYDKTISTTVRTYTTSGADITFTAVCPMPTASATYDYTSELSDAGKQRLIINEPLVLGYGGTPWLTAFVYEQQ